MATILEKRAPKEADLNIRVNHTKGVYKLCKDLGNKLQLDQEDMEVVLISALFHDITKFCKADHADTAALMYLISTEAKNHDKFFNDRVYGTIRAHSNKKERYNGYTTTQKILIDCDRIEKYSLLSTLERLKSKHKNCSHIQIKQHLRKRIQKAELEKHLLYFEESKKKLDLFISELLSY